jgi:hypothetical protein
VEPKTLNKKRKHVQMTRVRNLKEEVEWRVRNLEEEVEWRRGMTQKYSPQENWHKKNMV